MYLRLNNWSYYLMFYGNPALTEKSFVSRNVGHNQRLAKYF